MHVQGLVQILQRDEDRLEEVINDDTEEWSQSNVNFRTCSNVGYSTFRHTLQLLNMISNVKN